MLESIETMTKPNLLLLHGAIGTKEQFDPLMPLLASDFTLHRLNFEGHGDTPMPDRPFRAQNFIKNVVDYLDEHEVATTHILGYSLGGYVACMMAETHGDRIDKIVTLGTRYPWLPATAEQEVGFLDPDKIEAKVPKFARMLEERHTATGWRKVLALTADMLWANVAEGGMSDKRMSRIDKPIRIIVGDSDNTAGVKESVDVYLTLQNGQLEILPDTPHPFERVNVARLAESMREFCL